MTRRIPLVLTLAAVLASPAGAVKVVVPEIAPVEGAPASAVPVVPVLQASPATLGSVAAPAVPLAAPAAAPEAAVQAAAPVAAPVEAAPLARAAAASPAAAPAEAKAAPSRAKRGVPTSARAQAEYAAVPAPGAPGAAARLDGLFDAAAPAPALERGPAVPAAAESPRVAPRLGLKKAASPARGRRRTFKSPEGAEARELARLEQSLRENGLPAYQVRVEKKAADPDRPTVAILAPASRHKVAIVREGGRQSPGDVNLVLDASWLIREEGPDGRARLLMKKGVSFDASGQAILTEYRVPRLVRYFANYFTLGANDRADGVPYEKDLDVPQSNSLQLEAIVNDKLRMSLLGAENGVEVPAQLTLAMPEHPLAGHPQSAEGGRVSVAPMPEGAGRAAEVRRLVEAFLDRYDGAEVVVKPSGPQFHSGRGVRFFRRDERREIVAHAIALSRDPMMTADGAVIVAGRVESAPLERGGRKMETTLRVLAARTPWGGAVTTDLFARVGPWGKPTTAEAADPRDNATVEPWERLLKDWDLSPEKARALDRRVRAMGVSMMKAIMGMEKGLKRPDGGSYQGQTDLIGLDVMIEKRGDELVPVMIEVNDHDSGGQFNLDREMATDRVGAHSREWVATMLQRARRDALKGKRIVLVGAGYAGKRFIFERAKQLGVRIVLVDTAKNRFVRSLVRQGLVERLIESDNAGPEAARAKTLKKILASVRKDGPVDGVTSFWEDDVPLTAELAEGLGLPYHTRPAAAAVRSKARTRDVLETAGLPTPRHRRVRNLNSAKDPAERAALLEDFGAAADAVGYPAVIKPAYGAAALGVKRVDSREEALAAYEEMARTVTAASDPIFAQGTDLVLEQYLDGPEYDVDIVMRAGRATFSSLTDNKPTREPYFLATGSRLPSVLPEGAQREAVAQAIRAARALGLRDGVIHVEGKVTSEGPRLIEANGRMGGEYVRDWVRDVWGVDLVEEGLMTAARIGGRPFKPAEPLTYLDGDFLIPAKSGVIQRFGVPKKTLEDPGFHELRVKKKAGDRIAVPPDGYERAGMLVARGSSAAEAEKNLKALESKLVLRVK
jgi:carnosine synthase